MSDMPYPSYEDVMRESREIAASNPELAVYSEVGQSEEGRAIPLLTITDPAIPAAKKSVFLLSGGTDGSEEVGRGVALGMARTLLVPMHRAHLQRQVVLVVPVTNPDGTVRDQADRLGNARGIAATAVHMQDQPPATAEGRAMRALVEEWIPDAHVDFHGLAGGSMGDSAFLYPTVNAKWSIPILMQVDAEMAEAAARTGWPQQGRPRLWWEPRYNLPGWLARNYSSFCMVVEGTENYYPIEDSVQSGLVRLLRFMEIGEEVRFFQDFPNYPVDVVSGGRMGALMSYGSDYTQRRKSRRDISQMIVQGVPWLERLPNDYDWTAVIAWPVEDTVRTFPQGMRFKATIDRRATIKQVLWQDHVLEPQLWTQRMTSAGIVITADVPDAPRRGRNQLSIRYEVPFKRHVTRRPEGNG
jgi:hypothetical protein